MNKKEIEMSKEKRELTAHTAKIVNRLLLSSVVLGFTLLMSGIILGVFDEGYLRFILLAVPAFIYQYLCGAPV